MSRETVNGETDGCIKLCGAIELYMLRGTCADSYACNVGPVRHILKLSLLCPCVTKSFFL